MPTPAPDREPVFVARGLTKVYGEGETAVHALRGVDLDVVRGEFVVLLGASGSGKSTLLNILGGLDSATSGQAWFRDLEITALDSDGLTEYRRRSIGFVFQFYNLIASLTARENVQLITDIAESPMTPEEALALVGLEDRLDNPIGTLSGGQRQALTLLMATWLKPRLLLLDEHTAALDPKSAAQVAALTREIIQRDQLTALMVTHSMQQAVDLPDRIVMMHKGQIVRQIGGEDRFRVRVPDLLSAFDRVRRREQLDEGVADVLRNQYR